MPDSRLFMMPYTFRVEGIAKGCRKVETHYFRDTIPVRIPMLDASDVPLTLDFGVDTYGRRVTRHAFEGYPVRLVMAPVDGAYGRPRPLADMADFNAAITMASNPPAANFYWPSYPLLRKRLDKGHFPAFTTRDSQSFREITKDWEASDRARAESQSRHLVFIDGHLHALSEEPRWKVDPTWNGSNVNGYKIRLCVGDDAGYGETFALDRKEDALRFAGHVAGKLPVTASADPLDNRLIEWKTDHARISARRLLQTGIVPLLNQSDSVARLPRGFFDAYCDLRDLHDARKLDMHSVIGPAKAMMEALGQTHPSASGLASSLIQRIDATVWRMEHIEVPKAGPLSEPGDEDEESLALAFT